MEQENRRVVMHRKENLEQEFTEIQEKLKVTAEILSEFSHNLSRRPTQIVIAKYLQHKQGIRKTKYTLIKVRLNRLLT